MLPFFSYLITALKLKIDKRIESGLGEIEYYIVNKQYEYGRISRCTPGELFFSERTPILF